MRLYKLCVPLQAMSSMCVISDNKVDLWAVVGWMLRCHLTPDAGKTQQDIVRPTLPCSIRPALNPSPPLSFTPPHSHPPCLISQALSPWEVRDNSLSRSTHLISPESICFWRLRIFQGGPLYQCLSRRANLGWGRVRDGRRAYFGIDPAWPSL